jgi:hypothetical protein
VRLTIVVKYFVLTFIAIFPVVFVAAQEEVGPVLRNPSVHSGSPLNSAHKQLAKKTTISLPLPFFEDPQAVALFPILPNGRTF